MKASRSLIDSMLDHLWGRWGAAPFLVNDGFAALAIAHKRAIERQVASKDKPISACVVIFGTLLANAVKDAYRSAAGLGVVKYGARSYSLTRPAGVQRLIIPDKAALRDTLQRLADDLDAERDRLDERRATVASALAALDRDAECESVIDSGGEVLGAIGRAIGDEWRTLRQLAPFIGKTHTDRLRFLELAKDGVGECEVQERKAPGTGRREFRVVTRGTRREDLEPTQIEPGPADASVVFIDPVDVLLASILAEHGGQWLPHTQIAPMIAGEARALFGRAALAGGGRRYSLAQRRAELPPHWPEYQIAQR